MGNAWFVRPVMGKNSFVAQFREKGLIAFDVRDTTKSTLDDIKAEPNFEAKTPEELRRLLSCAPYNFDNNVVGNWIPQIDAFVNKMAIDDLVLVPSEGTIFFARITSACEFERVKTLGFISDAGEWFVPPRYKRSVEWLEHVSRDKLSNELRKALKNRRVIGDLSKFYDEIDALSCGQQYTPRKDTVVVSYWLRPDFEITYTIPVDMTDVEAERLSAALKNSYFQQAQHEETPGR